MRRRHRTALIGAALLSLTIVGCGKKKTPAPPPSAQPPTPASTAKTAQAGADIEEASDIGPIDAQVQAGLHDTALIPEGATRAAIGDIGLQTPESVLHDEAADRYLVSNINGDPLGKDDNGFIARLTPQGRLDALKWIDGARKDVTLSAPKGMAISGGKLWVTDIDHLCWFHAKDGRQLRRIEVAGATFLNDLAAGDNGDVYLTDSGFGAGFKPTGSDAVYRVDRDGEVHVVARSPELGRPNGVLFSGGALRVVTMEGGLSFQLGEGGARSDVVELRTGGLDGVVEDATGRLWISSWHGKGVYRGVPTGPFELQLQGLEAPADIGIDKKRQRLLIPLFKANKVIIQKI